MPNVAHVVSASRRGGNPAAGPARYAYRRSVPEHLPMPTASKVTDDDETAMIMRYVLVFTLMGVAPALVLIYLQYLHPVIAPLIE